jgi:polysaccharide export outer membrane protein
MIQKSVIWSFLVSFLILNSAFAENNAIVNKSNLSDRSLNTATHSTIEKIYNNDPSNEQIYQAGYDTFNKGAFLSSNSKVSSNYKFNIGDKIDVFFWGDSIDLIAISGNDFLKSSNDLIVGTEGNVFIPGVGVIKVKDKTASQIEQNIIGILKSKFNNIHAKITLADIGNFPVVVTGNVKYKGTVYINSHSNLIDVLCLAGGILKTGSLREIVYINSKNNSKLTIDLYDVLIKGYLKPIKFNEGDVIFVKPVGNTVAIKAGVKTPAIYEFKNNETLMQIINYAGGLLPSIDSKTVQVETFDNKIGQKEKKDVPYKNLWYIKATDGDTISFKNLYNTSENLVYIEGNIKHPSSFQYKEGMKLSDILTKDELLPQTYSEQAVIERLSNTGKNLQFLPVSLVDFFNGYINPDLKPQDKIKIYPSTTAETIEVSGCIVNPGLIPFQKDMTLKKLLGYIRFGNSSNIQSVSDKNLENFNEIKTKNIVVEVTSNTFENSDEVLKDNSQTKLTEKRASEDEIEKNNIIKDPVSNNIILNKIEGETARSVRLVYLYDLIVKNDQKYDITLNSGDKLLFRELQANETVESVGIFGYVNSPGMLKYQDGMTLKDAIRQSKGLEKNGYLKGIVLLRPSIADEQRKNLENSLIKLHEEVASKVSTIQSINASSSTDMNNFLSSQQELLDLVREKAQKDYGRLMLDITSNNLDDLDESTNIELKPGDEIFIPYSPKHVVVIGEVLNNIAVSYKPDTSSKYYIDKVGGYGEYAKKEQTYIIKANGSAKKISKFSKDKIEAGDTIVVPKKIVTPVNWIEIMKNTAQIIGNIFSSMYILTKI